MKRLLYIILLTFGSLAVFAQIPTKYVNLLPAYPPAIGVTQYSNFVYTNSGLYMHDIILDSLPHYEIEHIPDQTVRFLEDGVGFYVKADSLHSSNVVYSYDVDQAPIGPFEFNATTGRFKFYPDAADYRSFTVTFTATSGLNSLTQNVEFTIMPEVVPENLAIQSLGEMPSTQEYTVVAGSQTQMFLNNANRTAYSYSISGKDIIFDNNVQNKVWGLSGREDLYELSIFAERLYIRSALAFPQTDINIYAREIIFEDSGNEIASINTTPSSIPTITNDYGISGGNAGNIALYIKKLTSNYAKRFILDGAQGQCANRNGIPGNGGNGGVLVAPINIESYCDFSRGGAGVKYDVEGRAGLGSIIGAGQVGENGHFELIPDKYSWIHPYYISAVIRHLNDSYLNNYFSYSKSTANDYYNLIKEFEASDEWADFDATLKVELHDQLFELEGLLYQLNENLDYFGNPLGWVPMLSFEVLLNNYNNEIERAMPTLYLNYWLQHIDQTMESWVTASEVAAAQTESDIEATQSQINSLIGDIPVLEDKITVLQNQIEETQNRLEQIKAELLRKAKHNVKKKNRLNKAFGLIKAAVNCIPGYGQIASGALSVIQSATGFASDYFGISDTYGYESSLTDAYQSISSFDYGAALDSISRAIDSIKLDNLHNLGQTGHELSSCYNYLKSSIGPVYNSINNLHQVLSKSSAPNDQVQAEFDKLCAESAEYQNIKAEVAVLHQNYEEFAAILTKTFVSIVNLTSEVSNEMVTLDGLRGDVFNGNSQRDLQAMQCVEKMKQRAMNRLVKYHYYMRKAYEYRLLRPYQGEFSLETMYNRIEALIDQGQIIFDNSTPANFTDYSALSALFREELSGIIEDVIDELTYNSPEQTAAISIAVPRDIIDKINANEEYNLNMFDLGLFSPDEENIRIVGFDVQYLEAHTEGTPGMSTYMDIDLVHNGISRFRKNGEVYWFNHISKSTQNAHPNTWSIRYNPFSQQTDVINPSLATQSLLYSLLGGNVENIMLLSRPAAWSDIFVSKKVHTSGNADVVIDSLVLSLQYDFTRRPDEIRNIDIATSDGLLPYITCSEVDRNGRSNGKGSFYRSYLKSSGTVTFTAPERHGNYHFLNWTDRMGNVVSENAALIINKMTDQFYRANYELWIPVISVADTIYVGSNGGEYEVQIRNVGLGDIEMDWYVSDSLSTWVHLNGIAEGIDDGYFSFTYEALGDQEMRIDSLEILAPEIEGMSKMIYIVQKEFLWEVSVSIDPDGAGEVVGTGFYQDGANCTLTATSNENYAFVNWTENGVVVSSDATYNFIATANRHLVANFTSTINHWTPEDTNYSDNMGLTGVILIDGVEQRTETLEVGVFCGNECRGSSVASYFQPTDRYIVMITIYGNTGDNLTFKLYDHFAEQELDLTSPEAIAFNADGYGTPVDPYVLDFINNVTHVRPLVLGWNWYSTYIEQNGINGLSMLENSLGDAGVRIQGRNGYTEQFEYQGTAYWYGTLNSINNEQMYKVRTSAACNVEMVGDVALVSDHPITINSGWNWIGFPVSHSVSVTNALSGFTPEADDIIKGRNGYSTYISYPGYTMWYGTLNTLEPGHGFMYKSNSTTAKPLTFQTGRGEDVMDNITPEYNIYAPNDLQFASNMTVTAVIDMYGEELRSDDYELAAFVGDECRGSVKLMYVEPLDRYVAFLTVFGEAPEEVHFVLTNGNETQWSDDPLTYTSDATIGTLTAPVIIHFSTTGVNDNVVHAVVYPNPSKGIFDIKGEGLRKIEVINNYGQVKLSKECEKDSYRIDLGDYAAGTYLLRIYTVKGTTIKQLIKY